MKTKPRVKAGELAEWFDLNWKFPMKESNQVKVTVMSDEREFGRFTIPGPKLLSLPRDLIGVVEVVEQLWKDNVYLGAVKILMKLGNDDPSPPSSEDEGDDERSILERVKDRSDGRKNRTKKMVTDPVDGSVSVVTVRSKKSKHSHRSAHKGNSPFIYIKHNLYELFS